MLTKIVTVERLVGTILHHVECLDKLSKQMPQEELWKVLKPCLIPKAKLFQISIGTVLEIVSPLVDTVKGFEIAQEEDIYVVGYVELA